MEQLEEMVVHPKGHASKLIKNPYYYCIFIIICFLCTILGLTIKIYADDEKRLPIDNEIHAEQPKRLLLDTQSHTEQPTSHSTYYPWTIESEHPSYFTLERNCDNCTGLTFTREQVLEIHSFLAGCFEELTMCPVLQWPHFRGLIVTCDPIVRMRKSRLELCLDQKNEVFSGFIGNISLNCHALELLYKARGFWT